MAQVNIYSPFAYQFLLKCSDNELKAVLIAAYQVLGDRPNMHVPEEYIRRKLKNDEVRASFNKCIDQLAKKGYLRKHPTAGNMTYSLTECGNKIARMLIYEGNMMINWKFRCDQNIS